MEASTQTPGTTAPLAPAEGNEETKVVPVTLDELLAQVDDGSRFSEGTDPNALADELHAKAKSLKTSIVTVATRRKNMAEALANARRHVLRPDGVPDWQGSTRTWNALSSVAYESAFADLSKVEQQREQNAVRQHIARTYLETAIRAYVAETTDVEGNPVYPTDESMATEAFGFAVRRQYIDAGLSIPPRYMTPEDKAAAGTGGGPGAGPKNPKESAFVGIEGLNAVVPAVHSKAALKTVSDLVQRVTAKDVGAIEDRETVKEDLERIGTLAYFALKALDGKSTDKDATEVAGAFWTNADAQ